MGSCSGLSMTSSVSSNSSAMVLELGAANGDGVNELNG